MHSDLASKTYKRYEKFYAYFDEPVIENVFVEKETVKQNSVKLKDLFFPNGCAYRK